MCSAMRPAVSEMEALTMAKKAKAKKAKKGK